MNRNKMLIGGALALLLVAAVAFATTIRIAQAQGPTPTPGQARSNSAQTFWQSLATRLGTTTDRLQQAVKDAAKDAVAQSVQDGRLTQDQATQITQRIDQWQLGQGLPPFAGGHGKGFGRGPELDQRGAVLDAAAKALNMSTADLQTELRSGKSLADVAKEKGVATDTVKQAIVAAMKAQVDQAVQSGKLTADQATQMKQRIDQMAANWDLSKPFGRHGGAEGAPGSSSGRPGREQNRAPQQRTMPSPTTQG